MRRQTSIETALGSMKKGTPRRKYGLTSSGVSQKKASWGQIALNTNRQQTALPTGI